MERRIQEAIERDALKLRYRPRVNGAMRLVGADVEVVWDAPGEVDDALCDGAPGSADFLAVTRWAIVRAGSEIGDLDIPRIGFRLSASAMSEPALADDLAAVTRKAAL